MAAAPVRPPWSWPGVVAVILAGSLGLGWCLALVVSAWQPEPISEGGLNLLGSLGQTMAGAVAAYLGYQLGTTNKGGREVNEDGSTQDEPTPPTRPDNEGADRGAS